MGALGSFLTGTVAGVIGLGLVSWLVATKCDEQTSDLKREEK